MSVQVSWMDSDRDRTLLLRMERVQSTMMIGLKEEERQ